MSRPSHPRQLGDDITVEEVARRLGRSYSWAYYWLPKIGNSRCYWHEGVVYVRPEGVELLRKRGEKTPKRGRPRGTGRRASMGDPKRKPNGTPDFSWMGAGRCREWEE